MNYIIKKMIRLIPDKPYLQLLYFKHFKRFVDFKKPKTFNEKLQWLKLNDRNPLYTIMVDKYHVKEYVQSIIGKEFIIPTLGVWNKVDEIDFESLPNQFVLKWNHDSGSIVICKDKNKFNKEEAINKLQHGATFNGFWYGREWPYKNVTPRIIAEEYMVDESGYELKDYKFFCFNGEPKMLFVATDRNNPHEEVKFDFFDMDFNHMPFRQGHENAKIPPKKPKGFETMVELSKKLSAGIPHVRVDFYDVNGHVYFGEMTFYHFSGIVPFEPKEWDYKIGEWLKLDSLSR